MWVSTPNAKQNSNTETCRTACVMTNIQRQTAFFLVSHSNDKEGEAKKHFQEAHSSSQMQVWYGTKEREEKFNKDLSDTVFNTSRKMKILPALCSHLLANPG